MRERRADLHFSSCWCWYIIEKTFIIITARRVGIHDLEAAVELGERETEERAVTEVEWYNPCVGCQTKIVQGPPEMAIGPSKQFGPGFCPCLSGVTSYPIAIKVAEI